MAARWLLPFLAAFWLAGCSTPHEALRGMVHGEIAAARLAKGDKTGAQIAAARAVEAAEGAKPGENRTFAELSAAVALARAGQPGAALGRAMAVPKARDRILVLAALTRALLAGGFDNEARQAVEEAERLVPAQDGDRLGEFAALAVLARSAVGDFAGIEEADAILLSSNGTAAGLLALVAEDMARAGRVSDAVSLAGKIRDMGDREMGTDTEMYMVGRIVEAFSGDSLHAARDVIFDARIPLYVAALNRIALIAGRGGQRQKSGEILAAARLAAESHSNPIAGARGLGTLSLTQAELGDSEGALKTLERAEALLDGATTGENTGSGELYSARTFLIVAREALTGTREAEEAVARQEFAGDANEFLVIKALTLTRFGRTGQAEKVLDFAAGLQWKSADIVMIGAGYALLAQEQMRLRDRAGARRSARAALSIAEDGPDNLSEDDRFMALFFSALAHVRAGDLEKAESLAGQMIVERPEPLPLPPPSPK